MSLGCRVPKSGFFLINGCTNFAILWSLSSSPCCLPAESLLLLRRRFRCHLLSGDPSLVPPGEFELLSLHIAKQQVRGSECGLTKDKWVTQTQCTFFTRPCLCPNSHCPDSDMMPLVLLHRLRQARNHGLSSLDSPHHLVTQAHSKCLRNFSWMDSN